MRFNNFLFENNGHKKSKYTFVELELLYQIMQQNRVEKIYLIFELREPYKKKYWKRQRW